MRIAIVGAGAVGSLLGCLLASSGRRAASKEGAVGEQAEGGPEAMDGPEAEGNLVVLLDTKARYESLRASSHLVIKSNYVAPSTVEIAPEPGPGRIAVCDSPTRAAALLEGYADVVLLCVKSFHSVQALKGLKETSIDEASVDEAIPGLVGPETLVVSCQNGVDNEALIAAGFGWERTGGAVLIVAASIEQSERGREGVVHCDRPPRMDLGLFGPEGTPAPVQDLAPGWARKAIEALVACLEVTGVRTRVVEDIQTRLWRKLVSNAAMNPLSAVTGATLGEMAAAPPLRALAEAAMLEAAAVGRAQGYTIPGKVVTLSLKAMDGLMDFAPSMLQDMRAGRRLELEGLVGAVTRRGRERGVATPVLDTLEALLAGMTEGRGPTANYL